MYQKKTRNQWKTLGVKRKGRLDKSLPLCPGDHQVSFARARAKSNSIPLYYNTSRASSQEKFQIFFFEHLYASNIRSFKFLFLSNSFMCQIFLNVKARTLSNFKSVQQLQIFNKLQTSCEKAAPRSCKRAANFFFFQILRSCKIDFSDAAPLPLLKFEKI